MCQHVPESCSIRAVLRDFFHVESSGIHRVGKLTVAGLFPLLHSLPESHRLLRMLVILLPLNVLVLVIVFCEKWQSLRVPASRTAKQATRLLHRHLTPRPLLALLCTFVNKVNAGIVGPWGFLYHSPYTLTLHGLMMVFTGCTTSHCPLRGTISRQHAIDETNRGYHGMQPVDALNIAWQ